MSEKIETVTVTRQVQAVRLKHPDEIGIGIAGVTYKPEEDGSVLLPPEVAGEAQTHGFLKVADADKIIKARKAAEAPAETAKPKGK